MNTERFQVEDLRSYGYRSIVKDDDDGGRVISECQHEMAESIARLLNAATLQVYEVRRIRYAEAVFGGDTSVAYPFAIEEWIPVWNAYELPGGAMRCRIDDVYSIIRPGEWRKSKRTLDVDRLFRLGLPACEGS